MKKENGRPAPNHFLIETDAGVFLQSYASIIAFRSHEGKVTLDKYTWDYSRTTGQYRNLFLRETKKETERKIEEGVYKLKDLNSGGWLTV